MINNFKSEMESKMKEKAREQKAEEKQVEVEPKMAHAMSHEISHSQATYSVRRVEVGEKRSVYVTVAFAGVALMVAMLIGVVVIRRRSSRYPQHQGFIEVDTAASPEEKHV